MENCKIEEPFILYQDIIQLHQTIFLLMVQSTVAQLYVNHIFAPFVNNIMLNSNNRYGDSEMIDFDDGELLSVQSDWEDDDSDY